jgi:hypothetical protein
MSLAACATMWTLPRRPRRLPQPAAERRSPLRRLLTIAKTRRKSALRLLAPPLPRPPFLLRALRRLFRLPPPLPLLLECDRARSLRCPAVSRCVVRVPAARASRFAACSQSPRSSLVTELTAHLGDDVARADIERLLQVNPSVVALLCSMFAHGRIDYLLAVVEAVPGLRDRLLKRWNARLKPSLLSLATLAQLNLGLSFRGYSRELRQQYATISAALQVELFPPMQRVSAHLRDVVSRDRSGLYAVRGVGKSGRIISVRATLTEQLRHPGIRPALNLAGGKMHLLFSADAGKITKRRLHTLAAHRILDAPGNAVRIVPRVASPSHSQFFLVYAVRRHVVECGCDHG